LKSLQIHRPLWQALVGLQQSAAVVQDPALTPFAVALPQRHTFELPHESEAQSPSRLHE
jgi:hypothetical protein